MLVSETHRLIGACIEVHRYLGPGLLESVYEFFLAQELTHRGIPFVRQPVVEVRYRTAEARTFQPDFIVFDQIVVELKAVLHLHPVHSAQVRSYTKLANKPLGLMVNFNVERLHQGIRRLKPYSPLNLPISKSPKN